MEESSFFESAGLKGGFKDRGSVRECFEGFERPDTPEEIKKFRKSARGFFFLLLFLKDLIGRNKRV